jgi:hypothetical protein
MLLLEDYDEDYFDNILSLILQTIGVVMEDRVGYGRGWGYKMAEYPPATSLPRAMPPTRTMETTTLKATTMAYTSKTATSTRNI